MQIVRHKTGIPNIVECVNPIFLLHRNEPSSGILCVEDLVIRKEKQCVQDWAGFNLKTSPSNFQPVYSHVVGEKESTYLLSRVSQIYTVEDSPLETVMLATDGYIGKWAYMEGGDCYRIIALWHLRYKENLHNYIGKQAPLYIASRDKSAFKRVRDKTP